MGEVARLPNGYTSAIQRAAKGSRLELLVAMRDKVAAALDAGVPARELASLTRRLQELAKDIEAAQAGGKGDRIGQATKKPDERLY